LPILIRGGLLDFTKIQIQQPFIESLKSNDRLDFKSEVSRKTGDLTTKSTAKYKGLKFIIYNDGYCEIQGSLHKYFNDGKHNFNRFTKSDLKNVLIDLESKLGFDVGECLLHNIEFGVNIKPLIETNDLLNSLFMSGTNPFKNVSFGSSHCDYRQVQKQHFLIKAYDKKLQYMKNHYFESPVFRFEIKVKKMTHFKKVNLRTINDVLEDYTLDELGRQLAFYWASIIMYDPTLIINEANSLKSKDWSNVAYWLSLSPRERYKERKRYQAALSEMSEQIHEATGQAILKEWVYLCTH
jgi:hypothetical protein